MRDERFFRCDRCEKSRKFYRDKINHPVHAGLTIATAGLWGVSWMALCIGHHFERWTCGVCGNAQMPPKTEKPIADGEKANRESD